VPRFRSGLALGALLLFAFTSAAHAASPAVNVFPSPGSKAATPGTQIAFRGIPASQIGSIQVVGSKSGRHTGQIVPDSDGNGGSFLPSAPFSNSETVTVTTQLNVLGARNGDFTFSTVTPAGAILAANLGHVSPGAHGVQHFRSEPFLLPPALAVTKRGAPSSYGDIFVAPQYGPIQQGPMILDPNGFLVWFKSLPRNVLATDFRVQKLNGKPVLTWWQGGMNHGSGRGEDVIYDTTYKQIATVKAANGLQGADLHQFLVTNDGDAYIIAISPIRWPGTAKPLMDSVVQEIDIKTGLVLFEWHALDHVPLAESFFRTSSKGFVFDPFHVNSVALDRDGNLIVSLRNTWALYKIDHQTGAVIWTLGSNRSNFKRGSNASTAFQHDAIVQSDGTITMFDNGAGPPAIHHQSRALRLSINTANKTANLVKEFDHSPSLVSNNEGSAQTVGSDLFVGWGAQPYFSEFNSRGQLDFDAHFVAPTASYRAYRFPWSAQPTTKPSINVNRGSGGVTYAWVSWNGATAVARWRLVAGTSPTSLGTVTTVDRHGFQTQTTVHTQTSYWAVQALSSSGQVLGTSNTVKG
jgi:hypothetical protein